MNEKPQEPDKTALPASTEKVTATVTPPPIKPKGEA